jgi:LPXTG-motif cell wall-anchored protein
MSFGKHTSWRLLSPLVALLWVIATVSFTGAAHADTSSGSGSEPATGQSDHSTPPAASSGDSHAASPDQQPGGPPETPPGQDKQSTSSGGSSSDHSSADHSSADHSGGTAGTSGDVTQPQPISKADANDGGANGQCPGGPYCSTRDGSASQNGNGGGQATGKPCAGCVGKADNKNPKGQMPNGSDANAGYECDTNHGVGRGNPAHTGCQPTSPPECVPTEEHPCVPVTPPPVTPPPVTPPPVSPPVVSPPVVSPPMGGPSSVVVSPPAAVPQAAGLPNTGVPADLAWLAGAAVASILAGAGLLLGRRRMTA